VEKPQRGLKLRLLLRSDGLDCDIIAFSTVLDGRNTAKDYQTILQDHVHLMVQTFPLKEVLCFRHSKTGDRV